MVKSDLQAERFRSLGQENVSVTGEMRFEQPIPEAHLHAAHAIRAALAGDRRVITLASVIEGEEELFVETVKSVSKNAFFVFVPRAPERFDAVAQRLAQAGLRFARRSAILDDALALTETPQIDVLLGDSLGEMYFYLAMAIFRSLAAAFIRAARITSSNRWRWANR